MSHLYTVDYDLLTPGRDYDSLKKALAKLGAMRMMYSKWILTSGNTAKEILDYLIQFVDSNDRLFVAELSGDWAGRNLLFDPDKARNAAVLSHRY